MSDIEFHYTSSSDHKARKPCIGSAAANIHSGKPLSYLWPAIPHGLLKISQVCYSIQKWMYSSPKTESRFT